MRLQTVTKFLQAWCAVPWCWGAGAVRPVRAQEPVTAFVDVSVVPMDRERVLSRQTVLVRRDRIVALGPVERVRVPADAVRIDGRGKFLIPGLADMHAHIGGLPQPDSAKAERELLRYVANGVTTIRNMYGAPLHLALRARAAAGDLLSPRIYTAGPALKSGKPIPGSPELTAATAATVVAEQQAAGYDFLKIAYDVEPVTFDSLVAAADRRRMPYAGHVPDASLGRVLQTHYRSIEHLDGYLEQIFASSSHGRFQPYRDSIPMYDDPGLPFDESELPALVRTTRRAGIWNVPTQTMSEGRLVSWAPKDSTSPQAQAWRRLIALRRQLIKALHDGGAGLLLGTDVGAGGALGSHGTAVHLELQLLVAAGLTPYQALETGTRNVAVFLGTQDSTGTVARGKRADLVLLAADPLVDIRHTTEQVGVMLGGRWFSRVELERRQAALDPPPSTTP